MSAKPCSAWTKRGRCMYDEACRFAHLVNGEECRTSYHLRNRMTNRPKRKRSCTEFAAGFCEYGQKCNFAHDDSFVLRIESCCDPQLWKQLRPREFRRMITSLRDAVTHDCEFPTLTVHDIGVKDETIAQKLYEQIKGGERWVDHLAKEARLAQLAKESVNDKLIADVLSSLNKNESFQSLMSPPISTCSDTHTLLRELGLVE